MQNGCELQEAPVATDVQNTSTTSNPARRGGRASKTIGALVAAGALVAGGVALPAPPASAVTVCRYSQFLNISTGGCDGDMTPGYNRMVIKCRVVGSYFEYNRYSAWYHRYQSWATWLGCGDQGRVRSTWFEYKR